jgi:hypothetical protein
MQSSKQPMKKPLNQSRNQQTCAQGASLMHNKVNTREVPMMGILEAGQGRIGVFGDSSCVDDKESDMVRSPTSLLRNFLVLTSQEWCNFCTQTLFLSPNLCMLCGPFCGHACLDMHLHFFFLALSDSLSFPLRHAPYVVTASPISAGSIDIDITGHCGAGLLVGRGLFAKVCGDGQQKFRGL